MSDKPKELTQEEKKAQRRLLNRLERQAFDLRAIRRRHPEWKKPRDRNERAGKRT